jgi:hypothetical protein
MAIGDETEPLPKQVTIERALSFIQADADQSVFSADDLNCIMGHLRRHQEENGIWMWSSSPTDMLAPCPEVNTGAV